MSDYVDDLTIPDDAVLWRRIHWKQFTFDKDMVCWRATSAAFGDSPDGSPMSVWLAQIMAECGCTPEDAMAEFKGFGLVAFTAGLARELEQGLARAPERDDPAHAFVFGSKTPRVRRKFAKQARWVIPPSA